MMAAWRSSEVADMGEMTTKGRRRLLEFWLFISAFGIMFALLSWIQEAGLLPPVDEFKAWKGVLAVLTGGVLYWIVARNMVGGSQDD